MKTTVLKQTIIVPADPEKVYNAFMDSKIHSEFTGSKATGKPVVGAKFTAWDGYIFGKNLELVKGKKIVQEWETTEWPDYPPSKVEFVLIKKGNGTELTMTHSKVPAEQAEEYKKGWTDFYWKPMKNYFKQK